MTSEEREKRIAELRANQNRQPADDAELERLYNMRPDEEARAEEPKEGVKPVKKPKSKPKSKKK